MALSLAFAGVALFLAEMGAGHERAARFLGSTARTPARGAEGLCRLRAPACAVPLPRRRQVGPLSHAVPACFRAQRRLADAHGTCSTEHGRHSAPRTGTSSEPVRLPDELVRERSDHLARVVERDDVARHLVGEEVRIHAPCDVVARGDRREGARVVVEAGGVVDAGGFGRPDSGSASCLRCCRGTTTAGPGARQGSGRPAAPARVSRWSRRA